MGLQIDGIAASQAYDTSAESISIKGLDISTLQERKGIFNFEHRHPDPKDKDKTPSSPHDLLGAILFAKKIFGPEDCDDDRQLFYWRQVELPFLYIRGELFDDDGHDAARAMAAVIRFYHRNDIPCVVRFSIDGHTLERDEQELTHCVARDVALTVKPANHSCISGVLSDSRAKSYVTPESDRHNENGTERLPGVEFSMKPFDDESSSSVSASDVLKSELESFSELTKAMTAGSYDAAPGGLSGGAALSKEHVGGTVFKNRLKAAIRDWDRKATLKEHLVKTMADVHPEFLEKFVEVLESKLLNKADELHGVLSKATMKGPAMDEALDQTKALGRPPMAPKMKPIANEDEGAPQTPTDTQANDKDIENIRASIHANNPGAATHGMVPAGTLQIPGGPPAPPPHVPGLRVGLAPDDAHAKDIEAIRGQLHANNPGAATHGMVAVGSPEWKQNQIIMAGRGATSPIASPDAVGTKVLQKDDAPKAPPPALTLRGQALTPNPDIKSSHFDEDKGILHTPQGSFPMYIPSHDSAESKDAFARIMNAPKVNAFHNYAMKNWSTLNERLKSGTLPAAVVAHATLFSQLSPNTPVPMQELMYGHLVDYMRDNKIEPQDPQFGAEKHFQGWVVTMRRSILRRAPIIGSASTNNSS